VPTRRRRACRARGVSAGIPQAGGERLDLDATNPKPVRSTRSAPAVRRIAAPVAATQRESSARGRASLSSSTTTFMSHLEVVLPVLRALRSSDCVDRLRTQMSPL
jgi:hypothetical protein